MDKMSGEALGCKRRIVSKPPELYGVNILSCPYYRYFKICVHDTYSAKMS